ncbi:hypothetical protein HYZ99_05910 [Candidatus Peregrinibacteria bacterium]|nr:hypothetical protein [Candidatus Peregrinibacteria bacterium]
MSDILAVTKGATTYALFFGKELKPDGARFVTERTMPFQVGVIERPAGYGVKAHQHPPQTYDVRTTSEFLYLEHGKMEVTIYDEEWTVLKKHVMSAGDAMLSLGGGHSMEVLEPVRLFEVKQGPFPGDKQSKSYRDPQ